MWECSRRAFLAVVLRLAAAMGISPILRALAGSDRGPVGPHKGQGRHPVPIDSLPRVRVVGVGGAGRRAVAHLVSEGLRGLEFLGVDADPQRAALFPGDTLLLQDIPSSAASPAAARGLPGKGGGLGRALECADLVFIVAGMGDPLASRAAPAVARWAKGTGALTLAVVSEGRRRSANAGRGLLCLQREADATLAVPPDGLAAPSWPVRVPRAIEATEHLLIRGVREIAELLVVPGIISMDLCDIRMLLGGGGLARMGLGRGTAVGAARAAVSSPLLGLPLRRAGSVLLNVRGDTDLKLSEVMEAAEVIHEAAHPDASIIYGVTLDPRLRGEVEVTLIAARLDTMAVGPEGAQRVATTEAHSAGA